MGLLIKSTENKKIKTKGYDGSINELESVYARIEFAARPNGKSIECAFPYIYHSKNAYDAGASAMPTDIPTSTSGEISGNLEQSLTTAHDVVKKFLEGHGYEVEFVL